MEPGPMVLKSMATICNVEKVKEYISWCRIFFMGSELHVITISAANTVALKVIYCRHALVIGST